MSADNLTGQYVSDTFRKILQLSDNGSYIIDGTGSVVDILPTTSSYALTASYVIGGGGGPETDPIFTAKSASFATTGSNIFQGNQTINGNIVVTGSLTALQYIISSSVIHVTESNFSGSHVFGNTLDDTHQFTGSVLITGSSTLVGNQTITGSILMSGSSFISGVDYIDFDTTASVTSNVGRVFWNDVDGTLQLGLKGGIVSTQIGQGLVTRVVNKTVPNIDLLAVNYQVVVIAGAQGQRLAVKLGKGDNDANSAGTLGLVAENIPKNQEGFIVTVGLLTNRNTTGALQGETWNDGDILYLSPTTAGAITNIKPQAPQHTVIIGYVEYAHQNNGKIYVKIDNGYELDELHNVRITTSSLSTGDLLIYNSGSLLWTNSKTLSGSYTLSGSLVTNDGVWVQSLTASFVSASSITGSLFGTSSWSRQALTASFVTASNVFGPFGSNSVTSASYALTSSYASNVLTPGGTNTAIQYNDNGIFGGESQLTYVQGGSSGERVLRLVNGFPSGDIEQDPYLSGLQLTNNGAIPGTTYTFTNTIITRGGGDSSVLFVVNTSDVKIVGAVCQYTIFDPTSISTSIRTGTLQISFLGVEGNTLLNDFSNGGIGNCQGELIKFDSDPSTVTDCTRVLVNNQSAVNLDIIINVTLFSAV